MGAKKKLQRSTAFSAIITFVSFAYKLALSIMTVSQVLMVAAASTLLIFIIKLLFVKNLTKSRAEKKKAYFFMALSLLIYALIFIAFVVLKINGIDASNDKEYSGIIGYLLIAFMLIMFILSVINLRKSLEKTDIMVIGLKEMTVASAITDTVIIEEFIYRMFFISKNYVAVNYFHAYFPLAIGVIMVLISGAMFVRFLKYEA